MTEDEKNAPSECRLYYDDLKCRRKTGRAYRRRMRYLKHLRRYQIVTAGNGYDPRVGYLRYGHVDGRWEPVNQVILYPKNSNRQRWMKRETSARTRQYTEMPRKGNYYRRLFDYWWTLD